MIYFVFNVAYFLNQFLTEVIRRLALTVCVDHFRVVMNKSQKILCRNLRTDKLFVLCTPYLIRYHHYLGYAKILCQTFDILIGLYTARTRLNDNNKCVHAARSSPASISRMTTSPECSIR